ncbi:hypothetical protein Mgra_00000970 [Meloidogyne graminicola]|uniref:F-box domain-containing protein n=1 Tax=Meloidogyne graminicola TaxID=189291 RepID=A0A8T0A2K9_9BILA|nr:hypothetical protein Mgra_00000970 [Meloidogyne graminicola]
MIFYFLCGFSFLFVLLLMKKWQGSLARNLSNQNAFSARNLSNEIKFDIFKCLNFKGLTVIQKTNRFLNQFVEDYRNDLVLQNVYNFELVHKLVIKREEYGYIEVDVELVLEDFSLSDELKNKWEYAISVHIPLYLSYNEPCKAVIRINRVDRLLLRLPYYPKNIKEMLIIRSWLKRLSNCIFNDATFDNIIFNPGCMSILIYAMGRLRVKQLRTTLAGIYYK